MTKNLIRTGLASLALIWTATVGAVPQATVGSVDDLIASTYLATSSEAAEQGFIDSILGSGYTLTGKFDSAEANWQAVDGEPGGYAFHFADGTCGNGFQDTCSNSPDYFLIKLGTGGSPKDTKNYYLFENLASMDWAHVLLSQFPGVSNINIGRVSHISVGGGGTTVPEPATLALLGVAAAGLGFASRRRGR